MNALTLHEVIPDVLDSLPEQVLNVNYEQSGVSVNFGNELTPTQVKYEPQLDWIADSDSYYTVIMTDPDAPSRANPIRREFRHWLVVNVPGNRVSEGEIKTAFIGSGPPEGSGLHRYVFLVYKQESKQDFSEEPIVGRSSGIAPRANFNTKNFVHRFSLGQLIAANFYQAQYDEYCVELRKELLSQ